MRTTMAAPPVFARLCDDAAIFPPGNLPLAQAVPAHLAHRAGSHSDLVGPLVVALKNLPALADVVAALPEVPAGDLDLSVVLPSPAHVGEAMRGVDAVTGAALVALEVVVPAGLHSAAVVPMLTEALGRDPGAAAGVAVYVEVPRDARRDELFAELAGSPYLAKLRTGGVHADLYPDEAELAEAVVSAVRLGVPFKATAGLHHAVRNTDPVTGFEQHGFLNLLVATDAALGGADVDEVAGVLAERDGTVLAARAATLPPRARETFRSFGTCVISEPVTELADLGLLDRALLRDLR
ncbi:hypothetical protein [Nocardioides sp. SYSU DS0651]|uniref:hypothetical protein n=1 Tax=Nocardioides sp. SYSU DS0651 TaxID=3415955 RepID=UPI003F4C95B4